MRIDKQVERKSDRMIRGKCFKFALIGCGAIAEVHAKAIEAMDNAVLSAVYSAIPEQMYAFAQKHNCRWFDSVEAMLADEEIDIINICVPSGLHAQFAVMAAKAGKHIVVEKPMAITDAQLDEVVRAVTENGVKATVIAQLRFGDSVLKIKNAIDSGRLGRIYTADCRMRYYRSEEYYAAGGWRGTWAMDGGGALMNQGIHGIDLIQYLMGGIKSVYADCRTMARPIEVEDTANLLVEYCSGAIGVIQGSTICDPGEPRTITISGEKGTIVLQEDTIVQWDVDGETAETGKTEMGAFNDPMAISYAYHQYQFTDLVRAIQEDRAPAIDVHEGRKAVDIILAAYRSSKTGQKQIL